MFGTLLGPENMISLWWFMNFMLFPVRERGKATKYWDVSFLSKSSVLLTSPSPWQSPVESKTKGPRIGSIKFWGQVQGDQWFFMTPVRQKMGSKLSTPIIWWWSPRSWILTYPTVPEEDLAMFVCSEAGRHVLPWPLEAGTRRVQAEWSSCNVSSVT